MITVNTTFKEMSVIEELKELYPYLMWTPAAGMQENTKPEMTLKDVQSKNPTWGAKDMAYGLQYYIDLVKAGDCHAYKVYSEENISLEPEKECVRLFYMHAKGSRRFAILAAGGGYGAVATLAESLPVAARLHELGVSVFILNYRVMLPLLFPKPMKDFASAYAFIRNHADELDVDPAHYAVGGFSAGGHLAGMWATEHTGYRKYDFPAPELFILVYPMVSVWNTIKDLPDSFKQLMLTAYFGENAGEEDCHSYNLEEHVGRMHPPVYLIHAEDDKTVPIWLSLEFERLLKESNVPYRSEHPKSGGHGFGLGSDTEGEGWVERAVEYWDSIKE